MSNWLEIVNYPLAFAGYFFPVAAVIVFLHCFYDHDFHWDKTTGLLLFASIFALSIIAYVLPWYPDYILEAVIFSFVAVASHSGKRLMGMLRFLWVYIIVSTCCQMIELVSTQYIFSFLPEGDIYDTIGTIIINTVYAVYFSFVFFYLYANNYKKSLFTHWQKTEFHFIAIYSWCYYLIYLAMKHFGAHGNALLAIMGISYVVTAGLLPLFIYYLRISKHYQNRASEQEIYMQAELTHFHQYKQSQEETAHFRHDIKNNLLCMNEMLQRGKTQEATAYLQNLLDDVNTLSAEYITGDEILDSILAFKAQKMDRWGIAFTLDGVLAGGLYWRPVDICKVFANALDNAIEACEELPREQRQITMIIKGTAQHWFIRIENPVAEAVDTGRLFRKKDGYTTKLDSQNHGMGTYNMKHTVESYDGAMRAEYADHKFILEIMVLKAGV